MAVEYGGMVTGEYTHAGIIDETWQTWDPHTQDLWLQEYFRTEAQQNYATDSPQALAFEYVDFIDTTASKTAELTDDAIDLGIDIGQGVLVAGALVLGILLVK